MVLIAKQKKEFKVRDSFCVLDVSVYIPAPKGSMVPEWVWKLNDK